MRGRASRRWLAAAWVVTALSCGGQTSVVGATTSVTPVAPPGSDRVWLAVYDIAADPQDLAEERTQMIDALGDALEGAVVISPAACFDGLPKRLDGDSYVLALQQSDRVYVRALAEQLDGHPRFVVGTTVSCTD